MGIVNPYSNLLLRMVHWTGHALFNSWDMYTDPRLLGNRRHFTTSHPTTSHLVQLLV